MDIERIKSVLSIEEVLDSEGIHLRAGRCKCPLHNGSNPTSFSVKDGYFHCFACGESGDVISLVQELYGLNFTKALEFLEKKTGSEYQEKPIKRKGGGDKISEETSLEDSVRSTMVFIERSYIRMLKELEKDLEARRISLSEYYSKRQIIDYRLEDLDELTVMRNYEKKRGPK